jgi:hypothetical protein
MQSPLEPGFQSRVPSEPSFRPPKTKLPPHMMLDQGCQRTNAKKPNYDYILVFALRPRGVMLQHGKSDYTKEIIPKYKFTFNNTSINTKLRQTAARSRPATTRGITRARTACLVWPKKHDLVAA